jgi:hypothetical protein
VFFNNQYSIPIDLESLSDIKIIARGFYNRCEGLRKVEENVGNFIAASMSIAPSNNLFRKIH